MSVDIKRQYFTKPHNMSDNMLIFVPLLKCLYINKKRTPYRYPSASVLVIRLGPWNKIVILLNSLKDNEVTKIKDSSSAHL